MAYLPNDKRAQVATRDGFEICKSIDSLLKAVSIWCGPIENLEQGCCVGTRDYAGQK